MLVPESPSLDCIKIVVCGATHGRRSTIFCTPDHPWYLHVASERCGLNCVGAYFMIGTEDTSGPTHVPGSRSDIISLSSPSSRRNEMSHVTGGSSWPYPCANPGTIRHRPKITSKISSLLRLGIRILLMFIRFSLGDSVRYNVNTP